MNVNGFTVHSAGARKSLLVVLVLLGASWLSSVPVQAAAVKKLVLTPSEEHLFIAWTHYLAQGPQLWNKTHGPTVSPAIKSTIWAVLKTDTQEQSLANPMIDYLLYRQSLHPRRFDTFHPRLGAALHQLLNSPTLPTNVPPPTYTPVPVSTVASQGVTPPGPQGVAAPSTLIPPATQTVPQNITPPAIPEPSSLIIALGMTGCGLWWRQRIRRRSLR
jgi:hypothetical protein